MMFPRTVDVLVFEGCPNIDTTLERVRAAITRTRVDAAVRVTSLETEADARDARFLGSPSVRVDGVDVEVAARARVDFGLQCRVYGAGDRLDGAPPVDWICAALRGDSAIAENTQPASLPSGLGTCGGRTR